MPGILPHEELPEEQMRITLAQRHLRSCGILKLQVFFLLRSLLCNGFSLIYCPQTLPPVHQRLLRDQTSNIRDSVSGKTWSCPGTIEMDFSALFPVILSCFTKCSCFSTFSKVI